MWDKAVWLGVPREEIEEKKIYQGDMNGRFAWYRLEFDLEETGTLTVDLSANSRYRLWINEQPVLSGPCRSSEFCQYYETVDVSSYLKKGKKVCTAQVLLCDSMYGTGRPDDNRAPLHSVATLPAGHRFAMEGAVRKENGEVLADLTTGTADWRVWLDNTWYLIKEPHVNGNMGALTEKIDFRKTESSYKKLNYETGNWRKAAPLEEVKTGFEMMFGILKTFRMEERPIPLLYETEGMLEKELGTPVFGDEEKIEVQPGEHCELLFDGDAVFNAYFRYQIEGGKDAQIKFIYFEKFTRGVDEVKRDDYKNGEIGKNGQEDTIVLSGGSLVYEPFWYRTMRFLKIEIDAKKETVCFYRPRFRKTGYPLHSSTWVSSSESWVEQVYQMCVRTLESCMMETYMDCPFWEQMQYPMDTRLQALFTYSCSTDTLLAKKALRDFHESMLPDGLIQGRAPSNPKQIISTFSLYYIFMIQEYYERTGDVEVLKRYRADVDQILEYYDRHIGPQGLVENLGFWDFVDWQEQWNPTFGRPGAVKNGPSTIINLMYALALETGAKICAESGRTALEEEYKSRQQTILHQIEALCWDETRGMYREGPSYPEFSQHAQSWAVLNHLREGTDAAELMRKTFEEKDVLRCYFSTCYELFRACEEADCYELTSQQMEWWRHLLDEHCTTCPETPSNSRSECHAWSALPMYELICVMAGIRQKTGKADEIIVKPHLGALPDLEGEAVSERGAVAFSYRKEGEETQYRLKLPEGLTGILVTETGETIALHGGENVIRS